MQKPIRKCWMKCKDVSNRCQVWMYCTDWCDVVRCDIYQCTMLDASVHPSSYLFQCHQNVFLLYACVDMWYPSFQSLLICICISLTVSIRLFHENLSVSFNVAAECERMSRHIVHIYFKTFVHRFSFIIMSWAWNERYLNYYRNLMKPKTATFIRREEKKNNHKIYLFFFLSN